MDEAIFLYTTWPDAETAQDCASRAVEQRLAACANLMAPMTSIYRWEGQIEKATETPMILKTTRGQAEALKALILSVHPYDLPCIVALPVEAGASHAPFLAWIVGETQ